MDILNNLIHPTHCSTKITRQSFKKVVRNNLSTLSTLALSLRVVWLQSEVCARLVEHNVTIYSTFSDSGILVYVL